MDIVLAVFDAVIAALHQTVAGFAAMGPPLIAGLRMFRTVRMDDAANDSLRQLAVWATWGVVLAAAIGLAGGVWRSGTDDGGYVAMLARFPRSAYGMVAGEGVFALACYIVWVMLWRRLRMRPVLHAIPVVLGATNLLYHFPPLMISQNLLAANPSLIAEPTITRELLLELMSTPLVLAKSLHIWGASLVVSGVTVALASPAVSVARTVIVRGGAIAALVGLTLQPVTGVVTLAALPAGEGSRLVGSSLLATVTFFLGILVGLHLMLPLAQLAQLALRPQLPARWGMLAGSVVCVMLLMSLAARW
ncbi:hypothetical protein [Aeoliella sp. SH292]|uniref:hypothetical protein n=1 Tax=Aeoliella sp. SH292 TaxID=3454464 RepID=UPI003F9C201F